MMYKLMILGALLPMQLAFANDSTGFVATGGVQYVKNPNIAMQTEDLFISKKQIRVDYQFKNLTNRPITENILFPLPLVDSGRESDYADTAALISSFKVWSDGQRILPKVHVRAFLPKLNAKGDINEDASLIDVTEELKACGWSDQELMNPWTQKYDTAQLSQKMLQCKQPKLQALLKPYSESSDIWWQAQIIYSWQQTFQPNRITRVQHQYAPLVGGSVYLDAETAKPYCLDASFKQALRKMGNTTPPYMALGYILKTGANWARPIEQFNLTIERDPDELVSLCWKGQLKKVSATQFKATERHFVPQQDIDLLFIAKP